MYDVREEESSYGPWSSLENWTVLGRRVTCTRHEQLTSPVWECQLRLPPLMRFLAITRIVSSRLWLNPKIYESHHEDDYMNVLLSRQEYVCYNLETKPSCVVVSI